VAREEKRRKRERIRGKKGDRSTRKEIAGRHKPPLLVFRSIFLKLPGLEETERRKRDALLMSASQPRPKSEKPHDQRPWLGCFGFSLNWP
jgi:hypothetical protein